MRAIRRVLGGLWNAFGCLLLICAGMQAGQWIGYGKGARDLSRLIIEMRQGGYETPDSWDRGDI
ncbi:hypothetical protein [Bradyrhizobium sp. S3.9.1]|jgi:hypothetical protein|uniref:hypothetical protein n=1 Tax=unclassified Bradyrhizobium TaxID=2631580 RepID=UPI00339841E4